MGDERSNELFAFPSVASSATIVEEIDGSNNVEPSVGGDLEQRMLAIQQLYQQKQADLLLHFQQSQAQLALQHIRISQQIFQEYVQQRNHRQRSLDDQNHSGPGDDEREQEGQILQTTTSETQLHRSAAGGSGTISARTREKLKVKPSCLHLTNDYRSYLILYI